MLGSKKSGPLFSIITVCRNAESLIGPTIASLAAQSLQDIEHLVIDGASTDNTVRTVREQVNGAMSLRIVSEPDNGIYDAMNKGIGLARGQWIYFLNAGDDFVDDAVLQRVAEQLSMAPGTELAYGDVIYRGKGGQRLVRFDWVTKRNLLFEHLCHQSVFARRSVFERFGTFDNRYRINADYDWLLRVFRCGVKTQYLGFPVAFYDDAGVSSRNGRTMKVERKSVRAKHLPKGFGSILEVAYRAHRKLLRIGRLSKR